VSSLNRPMRKIEVYGVTTGALETRATKNGTSVAEVVSALVLLDQHPTNILDEELAELDRRWARIQAGEPAVPHERVAKWLETWGQPDSKPWPRNDWSGCRPHR
jgi:hypothetical protein